MSTPAEILKPVFLHPGELYVGFEPACVSTVLGSCVTVTLYNPEHGLAAMCHAMLPEPGFNERNRNPIDQPYRYLSLAFPKMLEAFTAHGIPAEEIEAKIFGGADVMVVNNLDRLSIGASNVARARQLLSEAAIPLARSHVGGTGGRKLRFITENGAVYVASLPSRQVS
jgi:chemotaxis protein CheD